MDLYSNPAIREHAELIVRNNVIHCASSMVSTILQAPETWRALEIDEDEAYSLAEMEDFEEPAAQHIADMDIDDLRDYLKSREVETAEDAPIENLRRLALAELAEHGARDFCDDFSIEPDRAEVYEHWIVSSWLADKLEDRGYPVVRDFLGFTIWGRPTTGQAISLDSVILQIADECHKS